MSYLKPSLASRGVMRLLFCILLVSTTGALRQDAHAMDDLHASGLAMPFKGMYDCMHQVEDGATIVPTPHGHKVIRADGSAYMVDLCKSNRTRLHAMQALFAEQRRKDPTLASARGGFRPGWQAWYLWNTNTIWPITSFTGTWIVPEIPSTKRSNVALFPALQNLYTTPKGTPNGIIQPVIQYGLDFASGRSLSWSLCSWCVMKDGHWFYTALKPTTPGNTIYGQMVLTQTHPQQKWTIVTQDLNTSRSVVLNVQQTYDELWALVAFEGYDLSSCEDLPQSPSVTFSSLAINTTGPTAPYVMWQGTQTSTQCGMNVDTFPSSQTQLTIQF